MKEGIKSHWEEAKKNIMKRMRGIQWQGKDSRKDGEKHAWGLSKPGERGPFILLGSSYIPIATAAVLTKALKKFKSKLMIQKKKKKLRKKNYDLPIVQMDGNFAWNFKGFLSDSADNLKY